MRTLFVTNDLNTQFGDYFASPEALEVYLSKHEVDRLVFVIWHWKVPTLTLVSYDCYGMHTGPLLQGKGKGGSPIRNLKKLGVKWATLCLFRMTDKMDAGEVLAAIPISIQGTEAETYRIIDDCLLDIRSFLNQPPIEIPEHFHRLPVESN